MNQFDLEHPNRSELESFVNGQLSDDEQRRVEDHVVDCAACCDTLRSIPHDIEVERMRMVDAASSLGETMERPAVGEPAVDESMAGGPLSGGVAIPSQLAIPIELVEHPRYRIVKQLGAGGMGVVYQAEHRLMERRVALKIINAKFVNSEVAIERFRLEVKAAARLSHRNIVAAFDAEQAGDSHFLVMEFIDGVSLSELVRRRGKLSVLHACNYVSQVAHGLQHAYENGMVHRDIKPQNLMRTPKGTIKILDFGLARFARQQTEKADETGLTGNNVALGTPDYIAPEQARDSRNADIRADIYSLGCTLYYLLAGRVPFPNGSALDKVIAHCEHEPTPLDALRNDLPNEVINTVVRMMEKAPEERFQRPADVIEVLKPFSRPATSVAEPEGISTSVTEDGTGAAAEDTLAGFNATLVPLESVDAFNVPQADFAAADFAATAQALPVARRKTAPEWVRFLRTHRVPLSIGVIGVLLLTLSISAVVNWSQTSPSWTDLLKQVDPSRDATKGDWQLDGNGLRVNATEFATVALPYRPPAEFDFEVTFTRHSGADSIALHFPAGNGGASFDIDGWYEHVAGIQRIDGQSTQHNATRVENQRLINGRKYTARVEVRQGRVDAYLDKRLLATYRGDGSNLDVPKSWQLPDSMLGVSAYSSTATFHRIRIRPAITRD